MVLRAFAAGCIAAGVLQAAAAGAAESATTIRVVADQATVLIRPSLKGDPIASLPAGTTVEALERDGDWFWVLLDRDEHGTRRPGWIRAEDVEVAVQGGTSFSKFAAPRPEMPQARTEKPKPEPKAKREKADELEKQPTKDDDRSLQKAERELEKARREYEKARQTKQH